MRAADQFFDELPDVKVDKEALELGDELIKRKTGPFEPEKFKDDYTDAMWELIHAKIEGRDPEVLTEAPSTGKVINIMDALKKSVGSQDNKKSSTKSRSTKSKSTKSSSSAKNDNKSKTTARKKSA